MKPRALIIEDRPEVALAYNRALVAAGFDVSEALNLTDAYKVLAEPPPPDVVFLDLNLNERETANFTVMQIPKIKSYNPNMSVIVISGLLTPELIKLASLQGAAETKEKLDMKSQVDMWRVLSECLEKSPPDMKSRLEHTLSFLKSAAHKLSLFLAMKIIAPLIIAASLSFQSCTVTTTKFPDGRVETIRSSDGKTIMILVGAAGQIGVAAAQAAAAEQHSR